MLLFPDFSYDPITIQVICGEGRTILVISEMAANSGANATYGPHSEWFRKAGLIGECGVIKRISRRFSKYDY
jgi:hypothetical protein